MFTVFMLTKLVQNWLDILTIKVIKKLFKKLMKHLEHLITIKHLSCANLRHFATLHLEHLTTILISFAVLTFKISKAALNFIKTIMKCLSCAIFVTYPHLPRGYSVCLFYNFLPSLLNYSC